MEEKLFCGICKQIMEEPRILSCLHSFCTKCLIAKKSMYSDYTSRQASFQEDTPLLPYLTDRRKSSFAYSTLESDAVTIMPDEDVVPKIVCPSCKTETLLTNGGVLNLPVNFYLQNKIIVHKSQPPSCETCTTSVRAFCKCEQCDIAMCALCADSHTKFRDTALHTLVNLAAFTTQSKPQCAAHLQELGFFCLGCTELICFTCCNTTHSGHRFEAAARSADNYSAILSQALDHAKPMFVETAKGADKIRSLHSKINVTSSVLFLFQRHCNMTLLVSVIRDEDKTEKNRCNKVEDEINTFYEAYIEKVVAHRHELLAELRKIKERRLALLDECQNNLKEKLKGSTTAIECTEELLRDSTPEELLSFAPILLNKLDVSPFVAADITFVTSRVSDFLQFLPDERAPTEGQYQLFGIISTQSLSPENCTLQTEGLFSCRQHKKATFTLTTRDCENQLLLHGGEKIETELRYKDATQRILSVTVIDGGEGSYTLSFTPDAAGSLSWSILIRGTPIQGSPFTVCVSSLRPHRGIYHCCSFCSGRGNKTVTCGCGSQMPGGYKGCGHGHEGHPGRRHWSCCGNVLQNSECGRPNSIYNF